MKKLFLIPKNEKVKIINSHTNSEVIQKTVRDSYYEADELVKQPDDMYRIRIDDDYDILVSRSQIKTMSVRDFKDSDLTSDNFDEDVDTVTIPYIPPSPIPPATSPTPWWQPYDDRDYWRKYNNPKRHPGEPGDYRRQRPYYNIITSLFSNSNSSDD